MKDVHLVTDSMKLLSKYKLTNIINVFFKLQFLNICVCRVHLTIHNALIKYPHYLSANLTWLILTFKFKNVVNY